MVLSLLNITLKSMTNKDFVSLVEDNKWTFARTMPKIPHYYTLRKDFRRDIDFVNMAKHIREFGVKEKWHGREFIYFYMNGWKYWTMGCPLHNCQKTGTVVINRSIYNPERSDYDGIAVPYDDLFSASKYQEEDRELFSIIRPHIRGSVLDIGCGSGLFLDSVPQYYMHSYCGVDSSIDMLIQLLKKWPNSYIIHDKFRNIFSGDFDTIIALYGTASYFDAREVQMIQEYLNEGGKYILMTYADDYIPETHKAFHIPYHKSDVEIPGYVTRFGNYNIHTNFKL